MRVTSCGLVGVHVGTLK